MIGNLTIDKASMNISYFLYTIRIISLNGGRISRRDFVNQMADFIGVSAQKNGKENRTPYNKSKLPRYFGFVDIATDTDNNGINYLELTNRGRKLSEYIGEKEDTEPNKKYYINSIPRLLKIIKQKGVKMDIHYGGKVITFTDFINYAEEFKYKAENLEKSFNKIFDYSIDEEDLLHKDGLRKFAIMVICGLYDHEFEKTFKLLEMEKERRNKI